MGRISLCFVVADAVVSSFLSVLENLSWFVCCRWQSESSDESFTESGKELTLEVAVLKERFTALEEPVFTGMSNVLSILKELNCDQDV